MVMARTKSIGSTFLVALSLAIPCAFARGEQNSATRITTLTGSPTELISLNIGDHFSGPHVVLKAFFHYRLSYFAPESTIVIEAGSCKVGDQKISSFQSKINGGSVAFVRDLASDGFSVQLLNRFDEDLEGVLSCSGGEIRELSSGRTLAQLDLIGFMHRVPRWTTRFGHRIGQISFSFDSRVAGQNAMSAIESQSVDVRLLHAANYPASALYSAPGDCTVGVAKIASNDVLLKIDSFQIGDGGVWNIPGPGSLRIAMRISESAKVGDKSGRVACVRSGALTYTY
jgi:hypothetical protein